MCYFRTSTDAVNVEIQENTEGNILEHYILWIEYPFRTVNKGSKAIIKEFR